MRFESKVAIISIVVSLLGSASLGMHIIYGDASTNWLGGAGTLLGLGIGIFLGAVWAIWNVEVLPEYIYLKKKLLNLKGD